MSNRQPTEETFLNDVEKHEMKVLLDNGIYRHLRFKQPDSYNMYFDLVTWPGYLAYTGDMGSFVFARIEDMFEFFRSRSGGEKNRLCINLGYWGEKLQAVDRCGRESGHLEFSEDKLRYHIEDAIKNWIEDRPIPHAASDEESETLRKAFEVDLREEINDNVRIDDGEHEARISLASFDSIVCGRRYQFSDSWEWDLTDYTFRFIWCCYALAWSIQQYDKFKGEGVNYEASLASST